MGVVEMRELLKKLNRERGVLFKLIAVPVVTYIVLGSLGEWIYTNREIK